MKKILAFACCPLLILMQPACSGNPAGKPEQNMVRAMELADKAIENHFTPEDMAMARFYNPETESRSEEKGSVWMYTSCIEAVNAILGGLEALNTAGNTGLYDKNFQRYTELLNKLYQNAAYYRGTFELVSFTQTKSWSVYGVNRSGRKENARVEGIENVYDDQQWLVRELLESYKLTGDKAYLKEAEYLTEYILDGWDCTLDENGKEQGGIPWGPGYTTKHACSNGPLVSPLVWLYELYKEKEDEITHRYIGEDKKRKTIRMKKSEYYLQFAEAVYKWQKSHLLRPDGVYHDMMGGCNPCSIVYETVDGTTYRAHTALGTSVGTPYTYNCGTMISGASDLYRATGNGRYLTDLKALSDNSFRYFAIPDKSIPGHYTYPVNGFSNWFNGVLMRGYAEAYPLYGTTGKYLETFQRNLDYGYENFLYKGVLPADLLLGWGNSDKNTEGMFSFAFAAKYAVLAQYELEKGK